MLRLLAVFCLASFAVFAFAHPSISVRRNVVPGVLIAQWSVDKDLRVEVLKRIQGADPKRPWEPGLLDYKVINGLAGFLDQDGRVFPIVWSLTDPLFRAALEEGKVKDYIDSPPLNVLHDARTKLKCDYLMVVSAWREGPELIASIRLYQGRREVWRDDRSTSAQTGTDVDFENAVASVNRTWVMLMGNGPLKSLPQRPANPDPGPQEGSQPPKNPNPPSLPPTNNEAIEQAMKRLAAGEGHVAVTMLRDAVDAEPLEPERRRTLVLVLNQLDQPLLAAQEARRASGLFPERTEFRILAARAWLKVKRSEDALEDLNEAVARDPDAFETRMLLGELQLREGRFRFAQEHFDKALERTESAAARWMRGLCKMLSGDAAGGKVDWDAASKDPSSMSDAAKLEHFRLISELWTPLGDNLGTDFRIAVPMAATQSKDPETMQRVADIVKRAEAAVSTWTNLTPPVEHQRSHARWGLALKLLRQASSELQVLLQEPNEENQAQASITLGEALKQLKEAKLAYEAELKPISGS